MLHISFHSAPWRSTPRRRAFAGLRVTIFGKELLWKLGGALSSNEGKKRAFLHKPARTSSPRIPLDGYGTKEAVITKPGNARASSFLDKRPRKQTILAAVEVRDSKYVAIFESQLNRPRRAPSRRLFPQGNEADHSY